MRNTSFVKAADGAACIISAIFIFLNIWLCIWHYAYVSTRGEKTWEDIYPTALLAGISRSGFKCDFLFTFCMLFLLLFIFITKLRNNSFSFLKVEKKTCAALNNLLSFLLILAHIQYSPQTKPIDTDFSFYSKMFPEIL